MRRKYVLTTLLHEEGELKLGIRYDEKNKELLIGGSPKFTHQVMIIFEEFFDVSQENVEPHFEKNRVRWRAEEVGSKIFFEGIDRIHLDFEIKTVKRFGRLMR